jgi:hypothetical protein
VIEEDAWGRVSPSFIEPMKALLVEKLPKGDLLYEIKFDGYRALAFKDGKERCGSFHATTRSSITLWITDQPTWESTMSTRPNEQFTDSYRCCAGSLFVRGGSSAVASPLEVQ